MIAGRHPPQTVPAPHVAATALKLHAPSSIARVTALSVMALQRQTYNSGSCQLVGLVSVMSRQPPGGRPSVSKEIPRRRRELPTAAMDVAVRSTTSR
jgi:hypothetical protein